jgi:hypothetical protein
MSKAEKKRTTTRSSTPALKIVNKIRLEKGQDPSLLPYGDTQGCQALFAKYVQSKITLPRAWFITGRNITESTCKPYFPFTKNMYEIATCDEDSKIHCDLVYIRPQLTVDISKLQYSLPCCCPYHYPIIPRPDTYQFCGGNKDLSYETLTHSTTVWVWDRATQLKESPNSSRLIKHNYVFPIIGRRSAFTGYKRPNRKKSSLTDRKYKYRKR